MSPISGSQVRDAQAAAPALGQQLHILNASSERDIDAAFVTLAQNRADALLNMGNALFFGYRDRIIALAARYKVPAIYDVRDYVSYSARPTRFKLVICTHRWESNYWRVLTA
jgi:hypothetical protein